MTQLSAKPNRRLPRFQFSLLSLMVAMFVAAAVATPAFYLFRGNQVLAQSRLVGMLMVLSGPLLVMTILSLLVAVCGRGDDR